MSFDEEKLQMVKDENEAILKRTLLLSHQTEEIGIDTMTELSVQDEKLNRIDNMLDDIDKNQYRAKKDLNVINSLFGYVTNIFTKMPTKKYNQSKLSSDPNKNTRLPSENNLVQCTNTQCIQNKNNDTTSDLLDQLSNSVQRLKEISIEMNKEINKQTDTIDDLNQHIDQTNITMKMLRTKIASI